MGEGMPIHRDPFQKGRLIIQFTVTFPENNWIGESDILRLKKLLPPQDDVIITDDMEEVDLNE